MKRALIAALLLYVLVYVVPLGIRPLFSPDETRYAETPREMLASGDWVTPRLNGLRYFEKPVMGYWMNAVSMRLFGQNRFAVRLPSALASGLSALAVFLVLRKFGGGARSALAGAAILLSSAIFFVVGTFAVLDPHLTFFLTAALVSFFFAAQESCRRRRLLFEVLFGIACGCAFLTKGFLAFAVPVMTIVPYMIWERRWKELFGMAIVPGITVLVVVLPWCVLVHLRNPDFWHYFFWIEHVHRFASAHAQHSQPFWYFVPVFLGGAFPWTFLLPAALRGVAGGVRRHSLLRFAVCWFVVPFIFFSICRGKLGTYILPCFPAFAIIMTYGLARGPREPGGWFLRLGVWGAAALCAAVALTIVVGQLAGIEALDLYTAGETWKWGLFASAFAGAAIVYAMLARRLRHGDDSVSDGWSRKGSAVVWVSAIGFAAVLIVCPLILPTRIIEKQAPGIALRRFEPRVGDHDVLVTNGSLIRSVCWYYKRSDVFFLGTYGELEHGLSYPDSRHRFIALEDVQAWFRAFPKGTRILLILQEPHYREWAHVLPAPERVTVECKIALVEVVM